MPTHFSVHEDNGLQFSNNHQISHRQQGNTSKKQLQVEQANDLVRSARKKKKIRYYFLVVAERPVSADVNNHCHLNAIASRWYVGRKMAVVPSIVGGTCLCPSWYHSCLYIYPWIRVIECNPKKGLAVDTGLWWHSLKFVFGSACCNIVQAYVISKGLLRI